MSERDERPLTAAQREIMEIVWRRGEVTIGDLHAQISKGRAVARNTIQTMVVRLEERGWLRHVERGREFVYSPAKPIGKSLSAAVRHWVDRMFGGSPEQLVNALLEYRELSESELANIRTMIEEAEAKSSNRSKSSGGRQVKKGRRR